MTRIRLSQLWQLENQRESTYVPFERNFRSWSGVNLTNLFQKAWAGMGCEHTYVPIGEILPRHHEKTFAVLLLLLTLKSASKSERGEAAFCGAGRRVQAFPGSSTVQSLMPSGTPVTLLSFLPLQMLSIWPPRSPEFSTTSILSLTIDLPQALHPNRTFAGACQDWVANHWKKTLCRFTVLNVLQPNNNLHFKGGPSPRRIEWYKNQQHYFRVRGMMFWAWQFSPLPSDHPSWVLHALPQTSGGSVDPAM